MGACRGDLCHPPDRGSLAITSSPCPAGRGVGGEELRPRHADSHRVPLVPAPTSPEAAAQLAGIAARLPLIALATTETTAEPRTTTPTLRYTQREAIAHLPSLLSRAIGEADARGEIARIESLFDEARLNGVLTEPKLAERLGCDEEAIAPRLAMPAARAARQAHGIQYIEGFGLCTAETLAKAQAATDEVTALRADQPVGSAWMLRQLGRRLRAVTGASEGIECLIAYLGAA